MPPTTAELREALDNARQARANYQPYTAAREAIDHYADKLLDKLHSLLTRR